MYVGEWKNGKYNGQGTFTWSDGGKYVGEWKDGMRSGQGTQTYISGKKVVGVWVKNGLVKGKTYDKDGNIVE